MSGVLEVSFRGRRDCNGLNCIEDNGNKQMGYNIKLILRSRVYESVPNKIINNSFRKIILRKNCLNCIRIKQKPGERRSSCPPPPKIRHWVRLGRYWLNGGGKNRHTSIAFVFGYCFNFPRSKKT